MNNTKNNSILKYGLTAVAVCFIISTIYFMQFSLVEKVFLNHFYEINIHDGSYMHIHFVENSYDDRKITSVSFPQLPDDFFVEIDNFSNGFDNGYYRSEKFAHYNYNILTVLLRYNDNDMDGKKEESIVLDKALISYNNGDSQEVYIGKIILHKNMKTDDFFDSSYSSSSNDFTSTTVIKPSKDVVIEKITSVLDAESNGFLELTLNNVNIDKLLYPLSVKTGDSLVLDSRFLYDSIDVRKYNVYEIQKRIYSKDEEGNFGYSNIYNINYEPFEIFVSEKNISNYLKYRGVK